MTNTRHAAGSNGMICPSTVWKSSAPESEISETNANESTTASAIGTPPSLGMGRV